VAAPKNNRQLALQIPQNKSVDDIETRFLNLYDNAEAKQSLLRELVYVGAILRGFSGFTQQIMDLERNGDLQKLNGQEQRNAIANIIAGSKVFTSTTIEGKPLKPKVEAEGRDWGVINPLHSQYLKGFYYGIQKY